MTNEEPIEKRVRRRDSGQHPAFLVVYFIIALAFFFNHDNVLLRLLAGVMMTGLAVQFAGFLWNRLRRRAKSIDPPASD
ncbi:hypothetical protein ABZU25_22680 [Micromonospora sp. NPDC005215]|uniref:hypothetical protein n=1 Tax=Micromonospora sp. NPDC005215 TaxID=3157024 RepID=UPI0033BAC314